MFAAHADKEVEPLVAWRRGGDLRMNAHWHHFEDSPVFAGCGVMGVGANEKIVCRNAAELPRRKMWGKHIQ